MYLLLISLYEFGQFLRIILWISVPLVVVSMLVTTWLHYRSRRRTPDELLLSLSGIDGARASAPLLLESAAEISGNGQEPLEEPTAEPELDPEQQENIYKGILWMKEKYEQYRDMADRRYEQLREQLTRTEVKYQELLEAASRNVSPAGEPVQRAESPQEAVVVVVDDVEKASYPDLLEEKNRQIAFLQQQLDQRIKTYHQAELDSRENKSRMLEQEEGLLRTRHLLEEKQGYIDQLEGQLVSERRKIEDLVAKLQTSSQQLMTIYEVLDRSMKPADHPETGGTLSSPSES
ncbi:MAG TPA: hypothetical protein VGM89_01900 [Puia sp.]|jgi:hypothetical protein